MIHFSLFASILKSPLQLSLIFQSFLHFTPPFISIYHFNFQVLLPLNFSFPFASIFVASITNSLSFPLLAILPFAPNFTSICNPPFIVPYRQFSPFLVRETMEEEEEEEEDRKNVHLLIHSSCSPEVGPAELKIARRIWRRKPTPNADGCGVYRHHCKNSFSLLMQWQSKCSVAIPILSVPFPLAIPLFSRLGAVFCRFQGWGNWGLTKL